jgi:hypothetical protein
METRYDLRRCGDNAPFHGAEVVPDAAGIGRIFGGIWMKSYKGMKPDMTCRGFQYEAGKEYETDSADVCSSGFHACEYPLDVFGYYPPAGSRFFEVEQSGALSKCDEDTKVASTRIKIGAELDIAGMVKAAIEYTRERCVQKEGEHATGNRGAASATGYQGAASATGNRGAASATGDLGAASATGYQGAASATGYQGAASATGDLGAASATGYQGAASATGYQGAASAGYACVQICLPAPQQTNRIQGSTMTLF